MSKLPVVTALGSCRVVTPCAILTRKELIKMNQNNVFGFVHNAPEILQQAKICCGSVSPPVRLRPYLNIPSNWKSPPAADLSQYHEMFRDTDVFVVEISSIRIMKFKAFFLQIHRTREILAPDEKRMGWWQNLVRSGENMYPAFESAWADEVEREVAAGIISIEQTVEELVTDVLKLVQFLDKPVLLVSTFNTDYMGKPIPQRTILAEGLARVAAHTPKTALFDPTEIVLNHGLNGAIKDLGHYTDAFEPQIAQHIFDRICSLQDSVRTAVA